VKRLLALIVLSNLLAAPAVVHAQTAGCQFVLGFKTLHDMAPNTVGDCTDNEAPTGNGDTIQHTTKGLLVSRNMDGYQAFTDGDRTSLSGPTGFVSRGNQERYSWETDDAPGTTTVCRNGPPEPGYPGGINGPPVPCPM
jgi:hypothetical protein